MNPTIVPAVQRTAGEVAAVFDGVFATIDSWHARVEAHLSSPAGRATASLDSLVESFAIPAVETHDLLTGAGFVCAPGLLRDAAWHLAWWLSDRSTGTRRLATVDDPDNEQFRDYTALEWWRVPAVTHARHLTGPYVDYVCTDDYTVTITQPVIVGGELLGVVGVDALVDRLETELLPVLRATGRPASIVNFSGRVVTSTESRMEPGSILRVEGLSAALAPLRDPQPPALDLTLGNGSRVISCGDTSLALVVAPPA